MKQKYSEKIFGAILGATVLFVVFAFAVKMFNGSSTEKFEVTLEDSSLTDVIIITSEPYNETQWAFIEGIIIAESKYSSDVVYLNERVTNLLIDLDYAIVTVFISRKVETIIRDTR